MALSDDSHARIEVFVYLTESMIIQGIISPFSHKYSHKYSRPILSYLLFESNSNNTTVKTPIKLNYTRARTILWKVIEKMVKSLPIQS